MCLIYDIFTTFTARPKLAQGVVEDQEEDEDKAEESDEENDEEKEEAQKDSRSSSPVEEVKQHKVEVEVDVVTDGDEVPQEKSSAQSDSVSLHSFLYPTAPSNSYTLNCNIQEISWVSETRPFVYSYHSIGF